VRCRREKSCASCCWPGARVLPLACVPYTLASLADALGWRVVLRVFGVHVPFAGLWLVRLAGEAVNPAPARGPGLVAGCAHHRRTRTAHPGDRYRGAGRARTAGRRRRRRVPVGRDPAGRRAGALARTPGAGDHLQCRRSRLPRRPELALSRWERAQRGRRDDPDAPVGDRRKAKVGVRPDGVAAPRLGVFSRDRPLANRLGSLLYTCQ
jgi:hypothetical protein